ncbi:MAG TPA: MBL fold metallo-hydrolase [Synergistaceae bacterium]|jgi:glyoxylase-like metal-dependent hydrolase (beta-lactamase superfamily II)|nr:MBL fold metallo-hydrolase [Synergistaceae bacterium]
MRHKRFPLGPLWTNTYLVWDDSGTGFVVDPAAALDGIMDFMKREHITVEAVFLTHGHPDHIGGVPQAVELLTKKVIVSRHDAPMVESPNPQVLAMTGYDFPGVRGLTYVEGGERIAVGRMSVEVIATPGHTKGGTCYLATQDQDALLLTGDTLFAGSVGRTDLPGGDSAELERSIERLSAFPDGLMVLPGHGPESTIGEERRRNPFWPGRAGGWL